MLTSYLKIAWRNLRKQKVFATVNILGMSTALCVALLLSLTAYREWTYDNFHENGNQIYQLMTEEHGSFHTKKGTSMVEPLAATLKKEVPGVVRTTRIGEVNMPVRYGANHYYLEAQMVDADFLQMFTFPLVAGNKQDALQQLNQVIITQKTAASLFKQEEPVGKTIEVNLGGKWQPLIVSAVAANVPDNSGLQFDLLTRFENAPDYVEIKGKWDAASYPLFVQLDPAVTGALFERSVIPIVHKYYVEKLTDIKKDEGTLVIKTIGLKDTHLNPDSSYYSGLNQFYPWLMVILATMIIGIACINFINLSIARAFGRSSEIGLRKSLGAMDSQLMIQFWSEAFLLCFFSFLLSIVFTVLVLPYYNRVFGHDVALSLFHNPWLLLGALTAFLTITLLAGGYPAWKVARLNIVQVLKGKLGLSKSSTMRNGLIVVQFVVAIVLISCTTIIWQQLNFIQSASLGYNAIQVISIPIDNAPSNALAAMRNSLAQLPEVQSVTGSMLNLGLGKDGSSGNWTRGFDYKGRPVSTQNIIVDYDYAKTLDLKIVAGRDFSRNYGTDSTAVVINELMAKQLGEKDPIGVELMMNDKVPLHVIGVVKDYHFESLRKKIDPLVMTMKDASSLGYIFIKVQTNNPVNALKKIQQTWRRINPLAEHDASFLDENTQRMYRHEQRFSKIFMSGALLAIIISCMGLFAIAVLVMAHRQKEIGVRKVLGASVSGIVLLLSKDFLRLVLVAVVIASPVAWYFMHRWLQGFEFRVNIHWWVFVIAGVLAICIAFVTISLQSIKAALANPVNSLNRE
ncbi:ABC-type lipoprotein release transport system permease subunit [Chitinophaga niastensis]|uniref:ABC-type lipoprotein release transport system permease subunit n=1 Tax=Chitinophaga niastensis TaxID=536980 RepID=A0A2P8HS77_CHINA|nr:ABC transporter permease [Chitinophaga niastensis]PSL49067.1 ABC-type lipoprotein release transport system permease subunit [Chitinophaga niastensis]